MTSKFIGYLLLTTSIVLFLFGGIMTIVAEYQYNNKIVN